MKQVFLLFLLVLVIKAESITLLIDEPGSYNFGADIVGVPTDPGDALITVSANGVRIDLGRNIVQQDMSNTVTGIIGIKVEAGVQDVVIENGTIFNVTGAGIKVGDGCQTIRIEDVNLNKCQDGGMLFEGEDEGIRAVRILGCSISECNGAEGESARGISIENAGSFLIQNCQFLLNDAGTSSDGYGIWIRNSRSISFNNCIMSGNAGFSIGAGIAAKDSMKILLRNCIVNSNFSRSSGEGSFGAGIVLDSCQECRMENLEVNGNINPFSEGHGIRCREGNENTIYSANVESNNGGIEASGISLENEARSKVRNCLIYSNEAPTVYGIRLTGTCDNCEINKNEVSNNQGAVSFGILDELDPSTSLFYGNSAFNQATNYSISYPAGITLPILEGSLSNSSPGLPSGVGGLLDNISINL